MPGCHLVSAIANVMDIKQKWPIYNAAHMVNGDLQVNLDWVNNANAWNSLQIWSQLLKGEL